MPISSSRCICILNYINISVCVHVCVYRHISSKNNFHKCKGNFKMYSADGFSDNLYLGKGAMALNQSILKYLILIHINL